MGPADKAESDDGDGMIHERGSRAKSFCTKRMGILRQSGFFGEETGFDLLKLFFHFFVRVREVEIEIVERFNNGGSDDEAGVPLIVGGHDIPGRELRGGTANRVLVSGLKILPIAPFLDVSHGKLPILF